MAKRKSFLNEFLRLKKVGGIYAKDRSKGFRYLHNTITKRLAEGCEFKIGDLDFSRFTEDDLSEYMRYYERHLEPMAEEGAVLFSQISYDTVSFPMRKQYRGVA
ncbi:MAG: hypothetical protein KIG65_00950 [Eubacteriales bacterium]|nr:hypothetical protein [Eubacteriales bacterium]